MSGFFSCSRRTLSKVLVACFHFMIIRGLLDLVYLNFSAPADEVIGLQQYIQQRGWLQRPLSILKHNQNASERVIPSKHDVLTASSGPTLTTPLLYSPLIDLHLMLNSTIWNSSDQHKIDTTPTSSDICDGDINFQYDVDFVRGDLRSDTYNMSPGSANACCQQCEMLEACTHWTWAENFCWLKNPPMATKAKVGGIVIASLLRAEMISPFLFRQGWFLGGWRSTSTLRGG